MRKEVLYNSKYVCMFVYGDIKMSVSAACNVVDGKWEVNGNKLRSN